MKSRRLMIACAVWWGLSTVGWALGDFRSPPSLSPLGVLAHLLLGPFAIMALDDLARRVLRRHPDNLE